MTAPAFRASGSGPTSSATSTTIPKPTGTAAGDALYALVTNGGAAAAPTTVPDGWALTIGLAIGAGGWVGVYELVAGASEPASYTWDGFVDSCAGSMVAIGGADTTTPTHKVHATANLDSSSPSDTGVTTTVPDCLIIGGVGVGDNVGVSGWTATDPATLTERTEVLSTAGNDTTSSLASATGAQSAVGPTGALHVTLAGSRNSVVITLAVQPPQTAGGQSVAPTGAASGEAFGTPTVAADRAITASGIASAEQVGGPALTASVTPSAIPSAESAGTAALAVQLEPTAVGSGEMFGAAAVDQALAASGIASSEAFGSALLSAGAAIAPEGIGPGSAGTPAVAITIAPASIHSPSIPGDGDGGFGRPSLTSGAAITPEGIQPSGAGTPALSQTLAPPAVASTGAAGAPAVALAVSPTGAASLEAVGAPALTADAVIVAAGIASRVAFGTPALSGGAAVELPDLSAAVTPSGRLDGVLSASHLAASVSCIGRLDATVT